MEIKLSKMAYNFDDNGAITSVNVEFNTPGEAYPDYLNARFELTKADLQEAQSFDEMTRKDLEKVARKKLAEVTAVKE